MESESGRISIRVYGALADSLQPKERVLSLSFLEAASCVCTKTSYRDAADILNRFLGRTDINTIKALRANLGLRNSSNPVEKANDLVVAGRQKHNGMAWSPEGSGALAALQMIYLNNQPDLWFHRKELYLFSPLLENTKEAA